MKLFQTILILPGTVLILIPGILYFLTRPVMIQTELLQFKIAVFFLLTGLIFAFWTVSLFKWIGKGTPAPWNPPTRFVVSGPYRFVRNPMIFSVLVMLAGETLLFNSFEMGWWLLIFYLLNALYIPSFEEPALRKRFGRQYVDYCKNVPRWIPRFTPWRPDRKR